MQRSSKAALITASVVLIIGVAIFALWPRTTWTEVKASDEAPSVSGILQLVNEERDKVGVAPLRLDQRLNESAQMKADDMFSHNYFGHINSDGRQGYEYGFDAMNHECSSISENLRKNGDNNTVSATIEAWKQSTLHYTAMVDPRYELTGIAIHGDYVVQHFCDLK